MPFCGNCGAPVEENAQCAQCGSMDIAPGIDIDRAHLATPKAPGTGDRPSAAQIGACDGPPSPVEDEPWGPLQPLPATKRPSRTFDERERSNQLLAWRITRLPVLAILGWFTLSHLFLGSTWCFIDNVNLLIHEGGHVAFSWDGQTLHALGGTLGQLLMPAAFATYFLWWRRQRFAGVVCVWWVAENLVPIGVYMRDAPTQELPLLGGGQHDWAFLFGKWGLIHRAQDIGHYFQWVGSVMMIGCLLTLVWWTFKPNQGELALPSE